MVYVDESGIHDQSDASLEVYRRLGGLVVVVCAVLSALDSEPGLPSPRPQPVSLVR